MKCIRTSMTKSLCTIPALLLGIMLFFWSSVAKGQKTISYGLFTGATMPITLDFGLNRDFRFYSKFTLRQLPVGFSYGLDDNGFGFLVTPSYVKAGQKYSIKNTVGAEVGERNIEMNYISIPAALKLHMTNRSHFRLSLVASIHANFLVSGKETFTHAASKLNYPTKVAVPNLPGYSRTFDGVSVPEVNNLEYVSNDKFKFLQIAGGIGLHSDYDFNDNWGMNIDGRIVLGLSDPRKDSYLNRLNQPSEVPDLPGQRRDIYISIAVGLVRLIPIKEQFKSKAGQKKKSPARRVKHRKPKR